MKINNVEIELDVYDVEVAEKYEKLLNDVSEKMNNIKGKTTAAVMREQCETIFYFFNELFGPETDKKVFGNKTNLLVCLEAFESLIIQVNEQSEKMKSIYSKYSSNRAQRRTKK